MNVLFVTWDGPQVSYLESLFLPIFRRLAESGIRFHVLQFTWGDSDVSKARQAACNQAGITYRSVTILRRPIASGALLSALKGALDVRRAIKDFDIDVVMPRSTLPSMATLLALRGSSLPMVFDADGLPLDERVDFAGQSPTGLVYRLLRDVEAQAVRRAAMVITRTAMAVNILLARAGAGTPKVKFHVVSNGRDADTFSPMNADIRKRVRQRMQLNEQTPLLVYAGSIGQQYCISEMLQIFSNVRQRRADAHLLILTGTPELAANALAARPELAPAVTIKSVSARDVPEYLATADLGLALRKPSFSMQAVAPIKLGEYLLCGLPVVATSGIGDTDSISDDTGFLVGCVDSTEFAAAADWFIDCVLPQRENYRIRSRELGVERFSLGSSAQSYTNALSIIQTT
jgi:glycosyltransferase involved in cell wall biosynthesis